MIRSDEILFVNGNTVIIDLLICRTSQGSLLSRQLSISTLLSSSRETAKIQISNYALEEPSAGDDDRKRPVEIGCCHTGGRLVRRHLYASRKPILSFTLVFGFSILGFLRSSHSLSSIQRTMANSSSINSNSPRPQIIPPVFIWIGFVIMAIMMSGFMMIMPVVVWW